MQLTFIRSYEVGTKGSTDYSILENRLVLDVTQDMLDKMHGDMGEGFSDIFESIPNPLYEFTEDVDESDNRMFIWNRIAGRQMVITCAVIPDASSKIRVLVKSGSSINKMIMLSFDDDYEMMMDMLCVKAPKNRDVFIDFELTPDGDDTIEVLVSSGVAVEVFTD